VFLIAEGNPQRAKPYLRILEDYAPDASVTTDLRARMKLMDLAYNSPMEFFKLVASAGVGTR